MPMNPAAAQALGNLINDLNPYFPPNPAPPPAGLPGWQMDLNTGTAPPALPAPAPAPAPPYIQLEVDSKYPAQWTFAGEPQNVNTALRILYRYPITAPSGAVVWIEDYLLIGYQGSGV